jgi:electron transfer flavoprotein alpha subunit
MKEILVVAEIRQGEVRPITYELLNISKCVNGKITCILLGNDVKEIAKELADKADEVLLIQDDSLENFNSELYWHALKEVIEERKPYIVAMGHTSMGMDLAPYVADQLDLPIVTDIVRIEEKDGRLVVHKYVYNNKLLAELKLKESEGYVLTIRQGEFKDEVGGKEGSIIERSFSPPETLKKRFIEYIEPETVGVDISKADVIISVGRGIEDEANIELAEELAEMINGVVAGSRPVIDSGWLPKERQVGISGKTVKPKLYLALGISGAFQHIVGMKDSDLIIAINKDPEAPIFQVAHYGVVGDIFEIIPELVDKLNQ